MIDQCVNVHHSGNNECEAKQHEWSIIASTERVRAQQKHKYSNHILLLINVFGKMCYNNGLLIARFLQFKKVRMNVYAYIT